LSKAASRQWIFFAFAGLILTIGGASLYMRDSDDDIIGHRWPLPADDIGVASVALGLVSLGICVYLLTKKLR
jgi:hypothetical protein